MGTLKKIGLLALFLFLATALLSWQSGLYGDYCNHIEANKENCPSYNLLPFFFFKLTDFFHDYESTFIVLGTLAIAWFTLELRRSTDKLWTAGEKQIALARDEFNATHRPRVSIRRMRVNVAASDKAGIEFTIINTGEISIANCIWNANILLLSEIGAIHLVPIYLKKTSSSYKKPLKVGEGTVKRVLDVPAFDPADILSIARKKKFLHVVGFVAYTDAAGTTRRMGFFRYYDSDRQRFRKIDDPEYEYQD